MRRTMIFAVVLLLIAAGCDQSAKIAPRPAAPAAAVSAAPKEPAPEPKEKEEIRPLTQYSAKQALGRLEVQLKRLGQPGLAKIWNAIPERSAVYKNRESKELSWVVGGWVFCFEDTAGGAYEARVNCWGEVKLAKDETDMSKVYPRFIKPDELAVDNLNAHKIVLDQGGENTENNHGGWLMTIEVESRGIRPVWAGGCWIMPDKGLMVAVDAQTGEIYRLGSDGGKGVPLAGAAMAPKEWDGGFKEDSTEALIGRSDNPHLWPHCYREMIIGGYVFNRKLLNGDRQKEEAKPGRPASSWMTTGIINAALGNWGQGISDLNKAIELEPQTQNFRECRGFLSLVIRDLDTADVDIQPDAKGKEAVEPTEIFKMLRGQSDPGGFLASMHVFKTEVGFIPLELNIGMEPFKRLRQKLGSSV